jgi:hypothetical protein
MASKTYDKSFFRWLTLVILNRLPVPVWLDSIFRASLSLCLQINNPFSAAPQVGHLYVTNTVIHDISNQNPTVNVQ